MTTEQRRRVAEIFEAALDREASDRAFWAAAQAAGDPEIKKEVLSLLDHHLRAGAFLSQPIVETMPELLAEEEVLLPGAIFGEYTVIRELGRGGMGRVYLASDARLGRQVALKALPPHLTREPLHRERLRREARAAAGLSHPGICGVYALEEIGGELFIVTEYVDGVTLRAEIASGRRPSPAEIVRTAEELAAALAAAHAHGVIHRDLKPENIMRASDGRLKILDFGLARLDSGAAPGSFVTEPGLLVGTPAYMAPEQLNGGAVDARADVFALGTLLYEYVSGVHPFSGATPLATIARVLESDPRPLVQLCPQAPAVVVACIERCLRKPPDQRFRSGGEVVQALVRVDLGADSSGARWWRIHQLTIIGMYFVASALGWQIKEWVPVPATVSLFIGLGVGSAIGGVLRAHLVFTAQFNRHELLAERRRTRVALTLVDVVIGMALVAAATTLAAWPLTAVLTMALGVGIGLAAIVVEPSTTRAMLGDG